MTGEIVSLIFLRAGFGINGSDDVSMCISAAQARTKREISHRHLAKRPPIRSLYRDLAIQISCQQSSSRVLPQRSCQKTSYRDLLQRPGEESSDLAQRSFSEILNRDLTLRSLTEIFCGDLL